MPRVSEAHREARRAHIVRAALHCFHRNGFHPTTMDDIVRESGLSAGAVYTYFRSKDDLICEVGSLKVGGLRATIDTLAAAEPLPPPAEVVATLVGRVVELTAVDGLDMSRIIVQGWAEIPRNPALREVVEGAYAHFRKAAAGYVARWRDAGQVHPGIDPDDAAPAVVSLVLGFVVQRAVLGDVDPEAYARGATALLA
jgi:AcrR family transcriptional regulator